MTHLDVIIPAHNEEENIASLTERLVNSLEGSGINYTLIFVDDRSTDKTIKEITKAAQKYNSVKIKPYKEPRRLKDKDIDILIDSPKIKLISKVGKKGKAFAILEGAEAGKSEYIAMIDADLQYPPEAIPEMLKIAEIDGVCVANRSSKKTSVLRKLGTKLNSLIFEKFLLGLNCDSQSGLKVFRREILEQLDHKSVTSWTIDMPLLMTAKDMGFNIGSYDIEFEERKNGVSKVSFLKAGAEIAKRAIKLKWDGSRIYQVKSSEVDSQIGAYIIHKGKKFITHTHLPINKSAIKTFERKQIATFAIFGLLIIAGLIINTHITAIIIIGALSTIYFTDIIFSFYTLLKSLHFPPELKISQDRVRYLKEDELPIYSIMAPLYKEANVLPEFLDSIDKLDYPKEKLDVMLLLEEDDKITIEKAKELNMPSYVRTIIVPPSQPRTKPKACNYGLQLAKGEYVVIYDAEDRPDPDQLKKSYLGFQQLGPKYACLQSKLNYYNTDQNLLTRLFTAEYSLWFDLILPGLQSIETAIPLGGTSNHFRTSDLKAVHGWDAFNVTEDCDLGVRLFKLGKKTAIIDSVTLEEANADVKNWLRQRSRWIKGYFQTYFVHMRNPIEFFRNHGIHAFIFQLIIGLRISFILINPILWLMTIAYFTLYAFVGPQIEALFPPTIFYIAVFSAVFGNFMYLYNYMIGAAKRGTWGVIKYVFFIPFYWFMTSFAAMIALYQLIVKPHYWEKTIHGLVKKNLDLNPQKLSYQFKFSNLPILSNLKKLDLNTLTGAALLIGAVIFANLMSFLYSAYLGRNLSVEDFGLLALVGNLLYLVQIPSTAISRTITHKSAFFYGKTDSAVRQIWEYFRPRILKLSIIAGISWLVLSPLLASFFRSESLLPFILFAPLWIVVITAAVDNGFIEGNLKFQYLAILTVFESVVKFAVAVILIRTGLKEWIYLSPTISLTAVFLIGYILINKKIKPGKIEISDKSLNIFPAKFFFTSILRGLSSAAFLSFDVILAKHFLSNTDAGHYALLSLVGKMIYFTGTIFSQFTLSLVSREEGAGRKSNKVFYKVLTAVTASVLIAFVTFGVFGQYTLKLLLGGKINLISPYLILYSLSMVFFTIAHNIATFHQIKKRYIFPTFGFAMAILQIIGIYKFHSNVGDVVNVMLYTSLVYFSVTAFMHFFYESLAVFISNLIDFTWLFRPIKVSAPEDKLRILIFNWRDTKHIWAGGAEVYLEEIAKRFIKDGHKVTIFCGNDGKSSRNDNIDGIQIIRRGGFYTVYVWAFLYYVFKLKNQFDVIIDSENGIPFFSPLYAKVPVIGLIHHVHSEIILKELKLPFFKLPAAYLAKILESKIMPRVYKNCQLVAVSNSTKSDMQRLGFGKTSPIYVISPGVDLNKMKPSQKTKHPTILYLGRLMPYKSIDTLIKAFAKIVKGMGSIELKIAGFGESRKHLELLVRKLDLETKIKFLGKVEESEKARLMGSSWVFAYPSTMEGWGISIIEANACGTPVVASDVPGLRDSVKNPHSGYLVPKKDVSAFAEKIELLLKDNKMRESMSRGAISWAGKFTWDISAEKFLSLLLEQKLPNNHEH